jgi:hypothetical protein
MFQSVDHHMLSLFGRGAIALDENDYSTASDFLQRFLRRMSP